VSTPKASAVLRSMAIAADSALAVALRAVADQFEACEAADAAVVARLTERVEAAAAGLADWQPAPPVSGAAS
jgi:hypothetical protein